MKIFKIFLGFTLVLSTLIISSCGDSNSTTKPKTAKTIKKVKKNSSKNNVKKSNLQKELNLSSNQMKEIKKISAKYKGKISDLLKQKKWSGDSNKSTRQSISRAKNAELKKALGNKYNSFVKYQQKSAKKNKVKSKGGKK